MDERVWPRVCLGPDVRAPGQARVGRAEAVLSDGGLLCRDRGAHFVLGPSDGLKHSAVEGVRARYVRAVDGHAEATVRAIFEAAFSFACFRVHVLEAVKDFDGAQMSFDSTFDKF